MSNKEERLAIRIEPELATRARAAAQRADRSLSSYVRVLLRNDLEDGREYLSNQAGDVAAGRPMREAPA